jgi:hypothetical protein
MSRRPQSGRAKDDDTYQKLRRQAMDNDYEGFWNTIHEYEDERFKENVKMVIVAGLFGLFMYGCYYIFLK